MPKYATMKNAELEALLKERGLPHTGKKAEMVARLEEADTKKNEDEIDWDDDAAEGSTETVKPDAAAAPAMIEEPVAPAATETAVEGNNPQAVPNQEAAIDPAKTDDLVEGAPAKEADAAEPAPVAEAPKIDYSIGIAATDVDKEMEARKKRAERFGIKPEETDADEQKKQEREKRFGTTTAVEAPKGLDSALPERRKRGRDGGDDHGDNKRRGGRGQRFRGGRRQGGGGERRNGGGGGGGGRPQENGRGGWMSADDRTRADARKARFN